MDHRAEDTLARIEREEFTRGRLPPGAPPAEPRQAATIVLGREISVGFEVLLLRRPDSARFAAGAFVFPGGVVDGEDADPSMPPRLPESDRQGEDAALVAAFRELWEETGILLADRLPAPEECEVARAELLGGGISMAEIAVRHDLTFYDKRVEYFTRWITPVQLARRYDTRFFLARGDRQEPRLTPEHTAHLWATPSDALTRFDARELPMLYPTLSTLQTLAAFGSLEEALNDFAARVVEPIRAKLIMHGGRVRPAIPGDAGYADAE